MDKGIKRVIALGFFDGVHLGHSALLERTSRVAKQLGATPAVITFDVHPDTLVRGISVPLITSPAERADLIRRIFGIESVIILHFSETVMRMHWRSFVESLTGEMSAVHLVVGHDFHFGYKGEGNPERLADYCAEHGIGCDVIPKVTKDGITISSTYIRKLIADGDIERANEFLGHPHILVDTVRYGYKLGRTIGAPTINMQFPEGVLTPAFGVYATKVFLEDGEYFAVTNVGCRPTFGGERVTVESYILDYRGELYGRQVRVEFFKMLRAEMRFENAAALKEQIDRDARMTREIFEI